MAYTVRINGTVLSSLLFECANSHDDIEGYFLGALSSRITMANDDNTDQAYENREDFLIVQSYEIVKDIPYDMYGNSIKQIDPSMCVGYFKYRRNVELGLSVRDQFWMKSFSETVKHSCIAIISSSLLDEATHTYEFAFWDMRNHDAKLPLEVTNMSGSTLDYRQFMSNASSSDNMLASIISPDTIISHCDEIYNESCKSLQASTDKVIEKEKKLDKLKEEIEKIKQEQQMEH